MTSDIVTDLLAAAAAAHRAREVLDGSDLLVDGQLVLSEGAFERLKQDATPATGEPRIGAHRSIPEWAMIQVRPIPDDGAPHDIGNGKVAIVSPLDHKTVFVMPSDLLGGVF